MSRKIASTDTEVLARQAEIDESTNGSEPKKSRKPYTKRTPKKDVAQTDFNGIFQQSRAMLNSTGELWNGLTHPDSVDVLAKALPYALMVVGAGLLVAQIVRKKKSEGSEPDEEAA